MKIIAIIVSIIIALLIVLIPIYNNVRSFLKDVFSFFLGIKPWFKRNRIKNDVENNCRETIEELNQITPELNLPEMSLEWVKKDDDGKVLLEEGKAIVLLSYDRDNIKNIINTTSAYVRKALLPSARNFLSTPVRKAIDYTVIHKFIRNSPSHSVASTAFVAENLDDINQYQDTFNKVTVVDEEGMLNRILLREYSLWGTRIVTHIPSPEYAKEATDFLNFLYELLSREPEELTPLQFVGNDIKVGVLLVAKIETYTEHGLYPYLRRIREGFASGIRTFYLLARNDKIEILEQVYSELVATGNFVLQNGPKVFKDAKLRDSICYCIEVDAQGSIAKDYKAMSDFIEKGQQIEVIVERVRQNELKCLYNLIPVIIPIEEISATPNIRLFNYYTEGMSIMAIPLEYATQGKVKASVLNTTSNPQKMIDLNYSVGAVVTGVVQEADDMFINLLIKDTSQKAEAYRRDLTYSKHQFLHRLFPVGSEHEFVIIGADYIHNKLKLQLKDLVDPWLSINYKPGNKVVFTIYREDDGCFVTELDNGIEAILPYANLTWIQDEVDNEKKKYKRNQVVEGNVKNVDIDNRVVILTLRTKKSPYEEYFNSITGSNKEVDVFLEYTNGYGIIGKADGKFRVFIPSSETHIDDCLYPYQLGSVCKVTIKNVATDAMSLIGTFKPYIETPLQKYAKQHQLGEIVRMNSQVTITDTNAIYKIQQGKEIIKASLFIGEFSNHVRVNNLREVLVPLNVCSFVLKEYDYARNKVELSLKKYLADNLQQKRETLNYQSSYEGIIIGQKNGYYYLIILGMFIEGIMQIQTIYQSGTKLTLGLASNNRHLPEFYV